MSHTAYVHPMEVEIRPTGKVVVLGLDERAKENLTWCAATFGINRLFWVDGHLICTEVFEKSFEREIESGEFPISQVCYTSLPRYSKILEVEKGTEIPVVDASDMEIYRRLLKAIKEHEKKEG
ncbi:MAG: hypothetical protein JSV27_10485 [Candidatus Bathyarchaeota archaeon]|nr:MAG: hypothetical protein JSV27_10485 [Candidatus Bathyarchaeota archaeon]